MRNFGKGYPLITYVRYRFMENQPFDSHFRKAICFTAAPANKAESLYAGR